jgi:hypothetical protein
MRHLLHIVVSAVLVGLMTGWATAPAGADAAAPVVRPAAVAGGGAADYATDVFSDPWDFSNSSDLHLDPGPTRGLVKAKIAGGLLQFTAKKGTRGYFSPLWGGYVGSFLSGRDGGLAANKLNASKYTVLRLRAFASGNLNSSLFWFSCYQKKSSCEGGMPVSLAAGWNDIVLPIANNPKLVHSGKAWSGKMTDLRFAFSARSTVQVKVDTIAVTSDATSPIVAQPLPVVTSPSAAGCGDYAKNVLGHPWLTKRSDVTLTSAKLKSFHKGKLTAVNASTGPRAPKNDPHVTFKLPPKGINGKIWHRLTIVESYKGPFDLASGSGGGTMARVMWQVPGRKLVAQSDDLVTYTGKQTIVLDLTTNPKRLTDPAGPAGQRYTFKNGKVTMLRWDPNEDRGSRVWTLYTMRLAKDCAATSSFNVTWQDKAFTAGTTVQIQALYPKTGGRVTLTGPIAESGTSGSALVNIAPLKKYGKRSWTIQVLATNPAGVASRGSATGPLVVG